MFVSDPEAIRAYVVADKDNKVTDFISFYTITYASSNPEVPESYLVYFPLREQGAYIYYYAATKTPLVDLMNYALFEAKKIGVECFYCPDTMDSMQFLKVYLGYHIQELKFVKLARDCQHLYFHNYSCKNMEAKDIGMSII